MQKIYASSLIVLMLLLTSFVSQQAPAGKEIYTSKCSRCHGNDGTKGFLFAKNLQKSKMEDAVMLLLIQNGKRFMPSFKTKLTPEEIKQVAEYVKTLRK